MKKVVKFGGSSLADAAQFKKVAEIIHADESRVYVIPSAPGKRFDGDTKVTDLLYHMYEEAKAKKDFSKTLQTIKDRYDQIIRGLGLKNFSLDKEFDIIEHELLDDPDEDYTASRGEYLNGRIMARYLKYEFIDAQEVIFFHEDGSLNLEKTTFTLRRRLEKVPRAVVPGFGRLGYHRLHRGGRLQGRCL